QNFKEELDQHGDFDSRAVTLAHVQRGGQPTAKDRVFATQLGDYAVRLLLEGKGGLALGVHNNKLIATEIIDTLENHKHQTDLSLLELNDRVRF
ncbi:6-phosphofructokinase, partial [Ligilactobacillus pobuzihii]